MPQIDTNTRRPAAAVFTLLLACIALAACGSSSSGGSNAKTTATAGATGTAAGGTTGSTTGPASTGTSATGTTTSPNIAALTDRLKTLRTCMQRNGVPLPERSPGQGSKPGAGGLLGLGGVLPKGVSRASYTAALRKCSGSPAAAASGASRLNSPAFKQALAKFVGCMRENGVAVPTPNTSGNGPIFDTKGFDTTSAKFKAAQAKCGRALVRALPTHPAG
jgi:hypothetical protein